MSFIRVHDAAAIRTITLCRPEKRNALTPAMMEAITDALHGVDAAGARVVILKGEGESFCAGADIEILRRSVTKSVEQHQADAERVAHVFRAVWECTVPTIAAVHGAALAGGTGLATLCDFTLATPDAKFGYTEARIGFVPAVVSAYLALQVSAKTAGALLLTARIFGAEDARTLGLVTEVVAPEKLEHRIGELAAELIRNSPESLRATKKMLRAQHGDWLDAALAIAMDANAASRSTADFREGVTAFLEKRAPVWTTQSKPNG